MDLLLPVDSVVGLLAQAVESVESTGTMGGAAGESLTPSTPAAYDSVDEATGEALSLLEQERRGETLTRNVRQGMSRSSRITAGRISLQVLLLAPDVCHCLVFWRVTCVLHRSLLR